MKIKKSKFNAIDFLIVIAIIIAIAVIVYRGGLKDKIVEMSSNETIVYTLKINNLPQRAFELIEIGDSIYVKPDGKNIGEITDKTSQPASKYISTADGSLVKSQIPDSVDIFLTVECLGRVTDEGCMLGGDYFIAAGKRISSCTDSVAFDFEVTDAYLK